MAATSTFYARVGNASLWDTVTYCHGLFTKSNVAYAIGGDVAVCLHGYQRDTLTVEILLHSNDAPKLKQLLLSEGYRWDEENNEFHSPSEIAVQFLIAGEKAGKGSEVKIPEPAGELNVEEREGLSVVKLSRLIEMKLACGMNNLRRTHKDFADVVELIAIRKLDGSFARFLHSSLRETFRKLVRNAHGDAKRRIS